MRRIRYSDRARQDLEAIIERIRAENPAKADRTFSRIREQIEGLSAFATGRPTRRRGVFEKVMTDLPYLIFYAIAEEDDAITILTVRHMARRPLG